MIKKPSRVLFFFKRLNKKGGSGIGGADGSSRGGAQRWSSNNSTGTRWKKRFSGPFVFLDNIVFKIVSFFEAIFVVSTACFFFFCCGCHL